VLINQTIHYVDIVNWIMGGIDAVSATHRNATHQESSEVEDTAALTFRFANGAAGSFFATSSSHIEWECQLTVVGTEGFVEIRDAKVSRSSFVTAAKAAAVKVALAPSEQQSELGVAKAYYGPSHYAQIQDFIEAVTEGQPPFVDAVSAARSVHVVLAAYRAAKTGRWEKVRS
jgi:UDP-N-acetyl-2-amino-2-deoxyglucuronate dehydrogenase